MLSTRDPLQIQGHIQTGSEGRVKGFHANGNQKKAGVAILTSDKTDFKIKTNRRQRRTLYYDQRINNPRRRYNNHKYVCIRHRSTSI